MVRLTNHVGQGQDRRTSYPNPDGSLGVFMQLGDKRVLANREDVPEIRSSETGRDYDLSDLEF